MKKIIVLAIAVSAAAFIGCGSDKTELSFTNNNDPSFGLNGIIHSIDWASGNATWDKSSGYAVGETTESKEVSETNGVVAATILTDSSGNFASATVTITGQTGDALHLSEGSSNNFTLVLQ